jgi:hypothetical protein
MRSLPHASAPTFAAGLLLVSLLHACGAASGHSPATYSAGHDGAAASDALSAGSGSFGNPTPITLQNDPPDAGEVDAQAPSCGKSTISAKPRTVNVLLVIDKSGSMTDKPSGFSSSKWEALKTAMKAALGAVEADIAFGLVLFPYSENPAKPVDMGCVDNCCATTSAPAVDVTVGTASVPKILGTLDATSPGGGTPTAAALKVALDYFQSGAGAKLEGDRYVLLATDGGPDCNAALSCEANQCTTNLDGACPAAAGNCCDPMFGGSAAKSRCLDDVGTRAQIDALRTAGVKTLVVGIPGTEAYEMSLDSFAQAGGAANPAAPPNYFAVSAAGGAQGLSSVLSAVTKGLVTTCRLQLESKPPDPQKLNVSVDGTLIPQAGPDGWLLDNSTSPPTIVLQGATCLSVQANGANSVQVVYGCLTIQPS